MPIARQCCICQMIYGYHDVPEDGVSHGICESPQCFQTFMGDTMDEEATCSHSSSSLTPSEESSSVRKDMVSSLPPSS